LNAAAEAGALCEIGMEHAVAVVTAEPIDERRTGEDVYRQVRIGEHARGLITARNAQEFKRQMRIVRGDREFY
jgi:hypothetical protein